MAGNHGRGGEAQVEVLGIQPRAGHNRRGELLVLVVGGGDVSALRSQQGIFPGGEIREFEAPVIPGDHGDQVLRVLDVAQRDTRAGKWIAFASAENGAGNAETSGALSRHWSWCLPAKVRRQGEQQADESDFPQQAARSRWPHLSVHSRTLNLWWRSNSPAPVRSGRSQAGQPDPCHRRCSWLPHFGIQVRFAGGQKRERDTPPERAAESGRTRRKKPGWLRSGPASRATVHSKPAPMRSSRWGGHSDRLGQWKTWQAGLPPFPRSQRNRSAGRC